MRESLKQFDQLFLINMDERQDRLKNCLEMFEKYNIQDLVKRFPAITTANADGKRGIIESHVGIIKLAKVSNYKTILVFEDDCYFINVDYFSRIFDQLFESEWDVFYLGYNSHKALNLVKDNLLNIRDCFAAHAIAFNHRIYDTIIQAYENNEIIIWDVWLRDNLQNDNYKVYGAYPIGALQNNNYSDIEKKHVNYDFILERFYTNTKHLRKNNILYKIKNYFKNFIKRTK